MTKYLLISSLLLLPVTAFAVSMDEGLRLKREQKLPQAEAVFTEIIRLNPKDVAAKSELATILAWQGRYAEAVTAWSEILAANPNLVEPRMGLARVLYWDGQHQRALDELVPLLAGESNRDALLLHADILLAQNNIAGARSAYESARALPMGHDDRDLESLLARAQTPLRWRLDAGHNFDQYSRSRGNEAASYLQIGGQLSRHLNTYLRWDRLDQFDALDHQYIVGAYWAPATMWLIMMEAGGTPNADFRPQRQAQFTLEWLRSGAIQPLLSYRYFGYQSGEVHTFTPGLRWQSPGLGNLELRYALSRNTNESETGVISGRYAWDSGPYSPYIAIYQGKEALPPQAEAKFITVALGCVIQLDRQWSVRGDYSYEDRVDTYRHTSLALGLTYQF